MDLRSPLRTTPRLVRKPWGGRRLARYGKDLPAGVRVGESWEVADLPPEVTSVADPVSRVAGGAHDGATLSELIARGPAALLGDAPAHDGRFPLLVKLLDAREDLSVQVHPPHEYVAAHPDAHRKTESWVVLEAEPGSRLLLGLRPDVRPAQLHAALGTSDVVGLLRAVPAVPGEVHHLPAGLLHALGAGVLVAEVQTPSDTTFRVYDWAAEHARQGRALHVDAARECVRLRWELNVEPATARRGDGELVTLDEYRLLRSTLADGEPVTLPPRRVAVVHVLAGRLVALDADGRPGGVCARGGTFVVPAAAVGWLVAVGATRVLVAVP